MYSDISPEGYRTPYFKTDPQKKRNREQEYAKTLEQVPVLKDTIERLTEAISDTDSIKTALLTAKSYETTTDNALIALNIVCERLTAERSEIEARISKLANSKGNS